MYMKKLATGVAGLMFAATAAFAIPVQQAEAATSITVCIKNKCVTIIVH